MLITVLAIAVAPLMTTTITESIASAWADSEPARTATPDDLARWVNPYIGTKSGGPDFGTGGGAGDTFPGADVPFGMVQWSPDTVKHQHGGYFYDDNRIKGFSLTHLSGPGCSTFEDIPFIPVVGEVTTSPATDPARYVSTFSHANERLSPGYYGVLLDSGAKVELTTTPHTGAGRFTYPPGKSATLLVNTAGSVMGTDDAQVTIGQHTISGWAVSGRFCGANHRYRVHFAADFDQPFASIGTWKDGAVTPGAATENGGSPAKIHSAKTAQLSDTTVSGPGAGAFVTFDTSVPTTVTVRVGLSFVSPDGAEANLAAENTGRSFDDVAAAARAAWNDRLNTVRITGGTHGQRTTFYTALYHCLLHPNVISDADGRYAGFDGRVHGVADGHAQYSNFSGWDVYRSETQLIALVAPHAASDIARSMVDFAEQGGSWDRWTVANGYTGVMNGDPYHIIVSTMYAFGAKDFDASKALLLMIRGATQQTKGYQERPGLEDYQKLDYVAAGAAGAWGAAATTLEYANADFAIAQLARRLGDGATYDTFVRRAQNWQSLFNPGSGYIQPRNRDGSFTPGYDPASENNWVEGNGAQYTWMVPYNERGLIAAMGGNEAVRKRLDFFFTKLNAGPTQPYAFLGNEPTLETPYIYDYAGAPYKTQQVVRRALDELYTAGPDGLAGNDDLGELSSWYVWSAMGMYPMIPGRAELVLASPLFERVTIDRPDGQRIVLKAPGATTDTRYVTGLKVNGQESTRPWVPESFVATGGTLEYRLSATPDTAWGTDAADAPPSFADGEIGQHGYVDPGRVVAAAGGSATASVGVQDFAGRGATVRWAAAPAAGLSVTPSSGSIIVPPGQKASQQITVTVAAAMAEASYLVPISFVTAQGNPLPGCALGVLVAKPGSLRAAFNNAGVSPDDDSAMANYDGFGWAYSRDALDAAGVHQAGTVTVDGLVHAWPSVPLGEPDNVMVGGQVIELPQPQTTATKLSLLGSATGGKATGAITLTYTDGTMQAADVGFSDWTLGDDSQSISFGNRVAARMPYRNGADGSPQRIATYLFATAPITLMVGKHVRSVTLPAAVRGGALHVFSIAVG